MDEGTIELEKKNALLTFGSGLRGCPGRKLGIVIQKCLMILIYGKYDLLLKNINDPLEFDPSELIKRCIKLDVIVKPRKLE